jgi:glucose dehydrogenase
MIFLSLYQDKKAIYVIVILEEIIVGLMITFIIFLSFVTYYLNIGNTKIANEIAKGAYYILAGIVLLLLMRMIIHSKKIKIRYSLFDETRY